MRVLLSTIGSRGDVQPLVALALAAAGAGHDVRCACRPTSGNGSKGWASRSRPSAGRCARAGAPTVPARPSPEQLRQLAEGTVAAQFETARAARDRDVIVGATALQIAAPSVAEHTRIPYVFAAYCPTVFPRRSTRLGCWRCADDGCAAAAARRCGRSDAQRWNEMCGRDSQHAPRRARTRADRRRAEPHPRARSLARAIPRWGRGPTRRTAPVFQPGAWVAATSSAFLRAGAFLDAESRRSFRLRQHPGAAGARRGMVRAARDVGRRAIVARGWPISFSATTRPTAGDRRGESAGAVPARRGRGPPRRRGHTTAAAALAGAQVVVPQMYDQHYFARRCGWGSARRPSRRSRRRRRP